MVLLTLSHNASAAHAHSAHTCLSLFCPNTFSGSDRLQHRQVRFCGLGVRLLFMD
jgi:hypothetical protein